MLCFICVCVCVCIYNLRHTLSVVFPEWCDEVSILPVTKPKTESDFGAYFLCHSCIFFTLINHHIHLINNSFLSSLQISFNPSSCTSSSNLFGYQSLIVKCIAFSLLSELSIINIWSWHPPHKLTEWHSPTYRVRGSFLFLSLSLF